MHYCRLGRSVPLEATGSPREVLGCLVCLSFLSLCEQAAAKFYDRFSTIRYRVFPQMVDCGSVELFGSLMFPALKHS
jgi:hypothetical protein